MKSLEAQLLEKEQEIRELKKTVARTVFTQELRESGLPEPAQDRLRKRFKGSETATEIKTVIDEEKDYIRKARASGWRPNKGAASSAAVDLVESYRRMGLTAKEAAIAAGVESAVGDITESRRQLRDAAKLLGLSDTEAEAFSDLRG